MIANDFGTQCPRVHSSMGIEDSEESTASAHSADTGGVDNVDDQIEVSEPSDDGLKITSLRTPGTQPRHRPGGALAACRTSSH